MSEPNLQVRVLICLFTRGEGIKGTRKIAAEISARRCKAGASLEMEPEGLVGLSGGGAGFQAKTQAQAPGGSGRRKGWCRGAQTRAEEREKLRDLEAPGTEVKSLDCVPRLTGLNLG